ncbi:MAG: hypothetical protein KatS3mg130_1163 [Candidatus Sumerlaea sp.]|nr:MAG: hypothetical protein KatS3mg130_1163 [Candidatus Sumerlaea sp.]
MIKRCFECNAPLAQSGLIVAMEQREHFAITRHTEGCNRCAQKPSRVPAQVGILQPLLESVRRLCVLRRETPHSASPLSN